MVNLDFGRMADTDIPTCRGEFREHYGPMEALIPRGNAPIEGYRTRKISLFGGTDPAEPHAGPQPHAPPSLALALSRPRPLQRALSRVALAALRAWWVPLLNSRGREGDTRERVGGTSAIRTRERLKKLRI